jgi:hypothetical protein
MLRTRVGGAEQTKLRRGLTAAKRRNRAREPSVREIAMTHPANQTVVPSSPDPALTTRPALLELSPHSTGVASIPAESPV